MEGSSWQDLEIKDWSIYNELQLGPVQLLTIEKVLEQLLDLGNPSRNSNLNDVIAGAFVYLAILARTNFWCDCEIGRNGCVNFQLRKFTVFRNNFSKWHY